MILTEPAAVLFVSSNLAFFVLQYRFIRVCFFVPGALDQFLMSTFPRYFYTLHSNMKGGWVKSLMLCAAFLFSLFNEGVVTLSDKPFKHF